MRRSRRMAAFLSFALLPGAFLATGGPARAKKELTREGGFFLGAWPRAKGAPADGMRFYAPELNVHQGDQLNINLQGFHNAFFLPAGEDAQTWLDANANAIGNPFSLIVPDPDDTALDPTGSSPDRESLKANNAVVFPTNSACGADAAIPCSYDG